MRSKTELSFAFEKKIKKAEDEWNELGRQGWQYCKDGDGCIIFMREIEE